MEQQFKVTGKKILYSLTLIILVLSFFNAQLSIASDVKKPSNGEKSFVSIATIEETSKNNKHVTDNVMSKDADVKTIKISKETVGLQWRFSYIELIIGFIVAVLLGIFILIWLKKDAKIRIIVFLVLLFVLFIGLGSFLEFRGMGDFTGYQPTQPIAYSHKLHAGKLKLSCLYCHFGAEKSKHAGIPPANVCMNCHSAVKHKAGAKKISLVKYQGEEFSKEVKKIYEAIKNKKPIKWIKVHNLPDYVYFNHSQHVMVGGKAILGREVQNDKDVRKLCMRCHGDIATMETVKQVKPLTMGWCLECHKNTKSPSRPGLTVSEAGGRECARCHY